MRDKRKHKMRICLTFDEQMVFEAAYENANTTMSKPKFARELVLGNIPNTYSGPSVEDLLVQVLTILESHTALAHYAAMTVAQTVVNFEETSDLKGQEDHWIKLALEIRNNKISGGVVDEEEAEKILATKTMSRFARAKKAKNASV